MLCDDDDDAIIQCCYLARKIRLVLSFYECSIAVLTIMQQWSKTI